MKFSADIQREPQKSTSLRLWTSGTFLTSSSIVEIEVSTTAGRSRRIVPDSARLVFAAIGTSTDRGALGRAIDWRMPYSLQLSRIAKGGDRRGMFLSSLHSFVSNILPQINSKNKDLVILRLCNELIRRLSRAEDPVFCGRVYIFMFQTFPLGDKSSVNLRGNFHVENVTTFEEYLKDSAADEDEMRIDGDESVAQVKGDSKPEIDRTKAGKPTTLDIDTLYPVFWSLQHSFSNPPRLFEADDFKEFQRSLEATLAKFKEVPKVIQAGDSELKRGLKTGNDDSVALANTFNPKYLTSRDLFKLEVYKLRPYGLDTITNPSQLSDLAFQRHILVQALILIDFLLTLTEQAKNKPFYQNAQKAMQYSFTLREEDVSTRHCDLPLPRLCFEARLRIQDRRALG